MEAIQDLGAQLVAISPQLPEHSETLRERHHLTFPILFDQGNDWAQSLGLTHVFPEDLREVYRSFDLQVPNYNGDDSWRLPIPTRMVVLPDGRIHSIEAHPDYTVRPDPEETLQALRTR